VYATIKYFILFSTFGICCATYSQRIDPDITSIDVLKKDGYNPLNPARASFYSAIIPGLGQIHNKDYWKIPIVYGALATPIYYYSTNNNSYKRYRKAFKLRESGLKDEFTLDNGSILISRNGLMNAQKKLKQNRDTSLITFVALYVLQILDASISAHLQQFNVDDKISFDSKIYKEPISDDLFMGLSLNLNF